MKLDSVLRPPSAALSGRFFLVGHLPAFAATVYLLVLVWAGAPGPRLSFSDAWRTAGGLSVGELVLMLVTLTLLNLVLHPLQLSLVRLLEGYWPRWAAPLTRHCLGRQRRKEAAARSASRLPRDTPPDARSIHAAGVAMSHLRARYPGRPEALRPTALGNALAAMEDRAGTAYGWDTPVAWPRLYPLLGAGVRSVVDDRRDQLDVCCRVSAVAGVSALASVPLLATTDWWLALTAAPLLLAWFAYSAAVRAAVSYGESVRVAFDLHRFDLYPALHIPVPDTPSTERTTNTALSTFWRQGAPLTTPYEHPPPPPLLLPPQPPPPSPPPPGQ
ncbi:hypothetical protein [Streptomyces sp. NPDC058653]|uniref:hypothetical protein n=1 Tax=Streptomyces sp. NPDC058653 TaxID=3346576 RepID=UPI0036661511